MTDLPHDIVVGLELVELERYDCPLCTMKMEMLRAGRPISDGLVLFLNCRRRADVEASGSRSA